MVQILALGGAHVDRRGRLAVPFSEGASHPGTWYEEAGGGIFNAARCLSRLGHQVTLVAPRGGDAGADLVSDAAEAAGIIDRPFTFLDRATPSYTAILDQNGNAIAGLADMELYRLFSPRRLRVRALRDRFAACDCVFMDANLPAETLEAIAIRAKAGGQYLAALGISPAKVLSLRAALPMIDMLFINRAEAFALTGESDLASAISSLKTTGLGGATITQGGDEIYAFNRDLQSSILPPACETIVDVTGAGDALAGATLNGLLRGSELQIALRDGIAAAHITLASRHAFAPEFSSESLGDMVRRLTEAKLTLRR